MKVSIHQPYFMPWPGYFARAFSGDVFVWLDDVQFEKGGYTNRVKIWDGERVKWLTVPVKRRSRTPIREVIPKMDARLPRNLWAAYWHYTEHYELLSTLTMMMSATASKRNIAALDMMIFRTLMEYMKLPIPDIVRSSELCITSRKSDKVLDICKELGATEYISGPMGLDYLDIDSFHSAGIDVTIQYYKPEPYPQPNTEEFIPGLSVVDMICNVGVEKTVDHIKESLC